MLETLRGLNDINGFKIHRPNDHKGVWSGQFIHIDDAHNTISFKLQDGPTKEFGLNGCSLNAIISAVRQIIGGLDNNYPCEENKQAIEHLKEAYIALEKRKLDREKRGVYGTNQR